MPEKLWEAAVALAQMSGVYPVASALKINYENLKKRVSQSQKKRHNAAARSTGFIELDGTQLIGSPGSKGTVVELSRADGAKLTVRLPVGEDLDLPGLVEAFWRFSA